MLKILLIKRGAIGDILMTTPLVRQLRHLLPQAIIDYCVATPFAAVLENNQYLNNVISLDEYVFRAKGIIQYLKFVCKVRKKYDYIFILGKNWRLNLINCLFTGQTIGYAREKVSQWLLNKFVTYNDVYRYHGLYYLDLIAASGLGMPDYTDIKLDLRINNGDRAIVNQQLLQFGLDKFDVVVNSGGNNQYESGGLRMLPDDQIVQLLQVLVNKGRKIILLGGNVDHKNYTEYARINSQMIFNFAGKFNLPQSAYLISLAHHFYTTDCGAMHLGVIADIGDKMTCFFGPTCPSHVLPPSNKFDVIWNDHDIFIKDYPLQGKVRHGNVLFFNNLDINKLNIK